MNRQRALGPDGSRGDPPAVEFDRVGYVLGDGRSVLDGLSLSVGARETVVLVGRSGVGKTTVLKLVNRLLEPASGEIRVAGRPTREWDPVTLRRRTGYVIQEVGLLPHLTVTDNVALVPDLLGWDRVRVAERTAELLAMVGLSASEYGGRWPHQLSGGQRQRVGVARALAADPPLLLLDEPFGSLDPMTRFDLQREFRDLMARLGKAALFVTHDVREALAIGGRIGLLVAGGLAEIAPPARFLSSEHPEVRALVATLDGAPDG
ncbi:MAG: ATP-binding cassette domain-containing protein [Gemmatimonadota bacterium]